MSNQLEQWRLRPANAQHAGRAVSWSRLSTAISREEVGDLDEVLPPGEREWRRVGDEPRTADCLPSARRGINRTFEEAESDMTPMIDVTFQLLIFFMIVATYTIQKTLDLPGQQKNNEGPAAVTMEELEKNNIIAKLAADGSLTIQDKPVPLENVEQALRDAVAAKKNAELVLDVHDDVEHDIVVKVLDAAGASQIEKVMFVSRVKK